MKSNCKGISYELKLCINDQGLPFATLAKCSEKLIIYTPGRQVYMGVSVG